MKQTNVKSDRVAALLEEVRRQTGESKVDAVRTALELRLKQLESKRAAEDLLAWLEHSIWTQLPPGERGRVMYKDEEQAIFGY